MIYRAVTSAEAGPMGFNTFAGMCELSGICLVNKPDSDILIANTDLFPENIKNLDLSKFKKLVFCQTFHIDDLEAQEKVTKIEQLNHSNITVITLNQNLKSNIVKVIHFDTCFARTKSFYFDQDKIKHGWYYSGNNSYVLNQIPEIKNHSKCFINLNNHLNFYRIKLYNTAKQYHSLGYISNIDQNEILSSQNQEIQQLQNLDDPIRHVYYGYVPIANTYYDCSYFSVYVESCFTDPKNLLLPSEKTYEPLLKGHFILPFSNPGFIKFLKDFGFIFPDFIDYSYDSITDCDSRFETFIEEFKRIINLSWSELYTTHRDILLHNRKLFQTKSYNKEIAKVFV